MQISGNQNGFGFFSAYKVAPAPQRPAPVAEEKATAAVDEAKVEAQKITSDADAQREGLLLQSAHRTAGRTLEWAEALAEY